MSVDNLTEERKRKLWHIIDCVEEKLRTGSPEENYQTAKLELNAQDLRDMAQDPLSNPMLEGWSKCNLEIIGKEEQNQGTGKITGDGINISNE